MKAVPEEVIDNVIEKSMDEETANSSLQKLFEQHPQLAVYVTQENFDLLTEGEREVLQYSLLVIIQSAAITLGKQPILDVTDLEKAEEDNWAIRSAAELKKFEQVIDTYFESYHQEDLLAYVEDALIPDQDSPVTPIGREVLFIACKSLIDAIDKSN